MREPVYKWNGDTGTATCTVEDQYGRVFVGKAQVHPDDEDMKSQMTGLVIAEKRASIAAMKAYSVDCKVRLEALKQLYHTMDHSKYFDPKGYEAKRLYHQIQLAEQNVKYAKTRLAYLKVNLHEYLAGKDASFIRRRGESKK